MRFRSSLIVLAAAAVVGIAAIAEAQPGRGRQGQRGFGRGGFGMSLTMLAQNSAVQKEIETTEDQVADINKMAEEQRAGRGRRGDGGERPNFREMSEEERTKFFEQMREERDKRAKEASEKLGKILLPPQMKRLEEIRVQLMGLGALNDPEIAKKLKITEEQQKKMEEARNSLRESMGEEMRELFQTRDREKIRAAMAEMRKKAEDKVLAVLSSQQKSQFEKMKGKPFEMPEGGFFGRGGPGGRPGGDAQGQGGRRGRGRGRPQAGD